MSAPTPEEIARLRELDAARTQGPLEVAPTPYGPSLDGPDGAQIFVESYGITWTPNHADAEFIAAAANALPELLDAAEALPLAMRSLTNALDVLHQASGYPADVDDIDAIYDSVLALPTEVSRLRAELAEARGDNPSGFMSQREWEDWSNDLAALIPEDDMHGNPEGAQESIILATLQGWHEELAEARAVIERVTALADDLDGHAFTSECMDDDGSRCQDCTTSRAIRAALAPTQREEGE